MQPFKSKKCHFEGCKYASSDATTVRTHHMTHYKGPDYLKFVCKRCNKNYESHKNLTQHAGREMCLIQSGFSKQAVFMDECLKLHPEQHPKSKECSNCNEKFVSPFVCLQHFTGCVNMPIKCTKCNQEYATYQVARKHYEQCDYKPGDKDNTTKKAFFKRDKIIPPTDEDIEMNEDQMMAHIRKHTIEKLKALFARFPKDAFGIIGMTSDPIRRFTEYRKHSEVYQKHEASPRMKNDEFILFRCWSKKEALRYEYLLLKHTILEDGELHSVFGSRMNRQVVWKPTYKSKIKGLHYVYFHATRVPFTFRNDSANKTLAPSSSSKKPMTSKTPATKRSRVISDSDEEEILKPSKKKPKPKKTPVLSSDDDD